MRLFRNGTQITMFQPLRSFSHGFLPNSRFFHAGSAVVRHLFCTGMSKPVRFASLSVLPVLYMIFFFNARKKSGFAKKVRPLRLKGTDRLHFAVTPEALPDAERIALRPEPASRPCEGLCKDESIRPQRTICLRCSPPWIPCSREPDAG